MKKSQLKQIIREAILNEMVGDNVPFKAWEVSSEMYEEGPMVAAEHEGEFFTGTGIIELGSVDTLIDVIEVESISEDAYLDILKNFL